MKRSTLLILLALLPLLLSALNLNIENIELSFQTETNSRNTSYSSPVFVEDAVIPYQPGAPAIPVKTVYFELAAGELISDVLITPNNSRIVNLDFIPQPIPTASALSLPERASVAEPDPQYYANGIYPENQLYEFDTVQIGSHTIGRISYYSYIWNSSDNSVTIPQSFEAEISVEQNHDYLPKEDNAVSNAILSSMGIETRNDYMQDSILYITSEALMPYYEPLFEFRRKQGVNIITATIEEIAYNYDENDLQKHIRYYINEVQHDENINYVTLAGDVDVIPTRELFAFDCAYGAYDDENNIPGDMYYSCLDGNWDANGNGIYGEDDDQVDYHPDVLVSRLPLQEDEIEPYINMLIEYESGNLPNYNKAAGFSMELWTGSNSVVCQEYIYDKYFPDYYDISLISGNENTTENAYALLNDNQNIIQHTGHAGKTVLSLENGHVRNSNLEMLDNEWGGVFYSIGCWSAALDYDSIGENLVTTADKGLLGYVGNSRYGWGAPAAPGFGFSEFYQKQFMKNLFEKDYTHLAMANALQKIPFIQFFGGTSVFKWVAYELNAVGDSYFRIMTKNPENLEISLATENENYVVSATSNGIPIRDVVVSMGELRLKTDSIGKAYFPMEYRTEMVSAYKAGYKFVEQSLEADPFTWNYEIDNFYHQGESYSIELEYASNEEFIDFIPELTSTENIEILSSPTQITMNNRELEVEFRVKNFSEVGLLENSIMEAVTISILENSADQSIPIRIGSPEFTLMNLNYDSEQLLQTGSTIFHFTIRNQGGSSYLLNSVDFQLLDVNGELGESSVEKDTYVTINEYIIVENSLVLPENFEQNSVTIQLTINAEDDFNDYEISRQLTLAFGGSSIYENFENDFNWAGSDNWQEVDTYAYESERSLSCRPAAVGQYILQSQQFAFHDDLLLEFQYRYKMPMYGKDGVYFVLETEATTDTLIFLGAGGALNGERNPEVYIDGSWDLYSIDIVEAVISDIEIGEECRLNLVFNYDEEIIGFNQYSEMEEIGVFIDNLKLSREMIQLNDHQNAELDKNSIKLYPNPFSDFSLRIQVELAKPEKIKIDIFNVKGQRVRSLIKDGKKGENRLIWDGKDKHYNQSSSAVYLLKISSKSKTYYRKVVYIK